MIRKGFEGHFAKFLHRKTFGRLIKQPFFYFSKVKIETNEKMTGLNFAELVNLDHD